MNRRIWWMLASAGLGVLGLTCRNDPSGPETITPVILVPPSSLSAGSSGVTKNSVVLTGTVRPNGQATTCHFEYGTTTAYGQRTKDLAAGSDTLVVALSDTVAGLLPGTSYHFRFVASNSAGLQSGPDRTFITLVDFLYPLAGGSRWTYAYAAYYADPPSGITDRTSGVQTWEVGATGSGIPPYDVTISVTRIDTTVDSVHNGVVTRDTTYVTTSAATFLVTVGTDFYRVRWTGLLSTPPPDTDAVCRVPRAASPSADTLTIWSQCGCASARYVQGGGLVNWNLALLGNHMRTERLTLLSYTQK